VLEVNDRNDELPYPTAGTHRILAWSWSRGPSIVVARVTLRGRPWGRFVRKIGRPGWHATCYPTMRKAVSP
jgi:hypothetical protein